jgi:hypothetical protein
MARSKSEDDQYSEQETACRRDAGDAGAPGNEIEVTPEMIEAGIDCFYDLPELLGPSKEQLQDAVKRSFLAMLRLHSVGPH